MRILQPLLASLLCGITSLALASTAAKTTEYTLPNGLKLIVREDKRAPVVATFVWYKIGSSYEVNGMTGISHALEHMMFKGTKAYPKDAYVQRIAALGGKQNAFTSNDYTAYYTELAVPYWQEALKLEADRMQNLQFEDAVIAKELEVIKEERRLRTEDNPEAATLEQFNATAYVSSPYHHPTIGWMDDIAHLTPLDLKRWYLTWYAPNNAIVVVVGDVNATDVKQVVDKYFGPLKPSTLPAIKPQSEVPPQGEKKIEVHRPSQFPLILMGYPVPVVNTNKQSADPYVLSVLDGVLDGGEGARLTRDLIRTKGIAAKVDAQYDFSQRGNSLFMLYATPTPGHTPAELKAALDEEIQRLQTTLVTPEELSRVKTQVIAGRVFARDSILNQAIEIGSLEAVGLPWHLADDYVAKIKAVTPEQVQKAAQFYLAPKRRTIAILIPDNPVKTAGDQHV